MDMDSMNDKSVEFPNILHANNFTFTLENLLGVAYFSFCSILIFPSYSQAFQRVTCTAKLALRFTKSVKYVNHMCKTYSKMPCFQDHCVLKHGVGDQLTTIQKCLEA